MGEGQVMKDFAKELKDLDFIPRAMGRVLIRGVHDWIFLGQGLDLLESQLISNES